MTGQPNFNKHPITAENIDDEAISELVLEKQREGFKIAAETSLPVPGAIDRFLEEGVSPIIQKAALDSANRMRRQHLAQLGMFEAIHGAENVWVGPGIEFLDLGDGRLERINYCQLAIFVRDTTQEI